MPLLAVLLASTAARGGAHGSALRSFPTYRASSRTSVVCTAVEKLQGCTVVSAADGTVVDASSLLTPSPGAKARIVACGTHFGDFNAWEYAQQLRAAEADIKAAGGEVVFIGIGTQAAALKFAELLDFPKESLFADVSAQCHRALGFSQGAFPEVSISPYAKLFAMLLGVGSPGTLQAVARGCMRRGWGL